jgi:hypothetical protein
MREIKNSNIYDRKSIYQFIIENKLPVDARPIISFKVDVKNCIGVDLGDIHKIPSENSDEDVDRTKLAGRESWEGASIGRNINPLLEHKDAEVSSEEEFNNIINQQLNAIPFEDKDKLEYKNENKRDSTEV